VPVRGERCNDERGMQIVTSRDQHRGVGLVAENRLVMGRDLREAELVADVIGAQRGVVHHGAESDTVLEMREQHGAGEVPGAYDIHARNGGVESSAGGFRVFR